MLHHINSNLILYIQDNCTGMKDKQTISYTGNKNIEGKCEEKRVYIPLEKHLEMEKGGERCNLEAEEESLRALAVEEAHILSAIVRQLVLVLLCVCL
jgi:hypothetical protein